MKQRLPMVTIQPAHDERHDDGSREDRHERLSWPMRVRYGIVILIAVVSAYGAEQGYTTAHHIAGSIQTSRFDSAYRSCQGVDQRNLEALKRMKNAPAQDRAIADPLINALAPYYSDCTAYAHQKTSLSVPPDSIPEPSKGAPDGR